MRNRIFYSIIPNLSLSLHFWLEPKNEAKKIKTAPASLEQLNRTRSVCGLQHFDPVNSEHGPRNSHPATAYSLNKFKLFQSFCFFCNFAGCYSFLFRTQFDYD